MKKTKFIYLGLIAAASLVSCSDDDDNSTDDIPGESDRAELYVTSGNSGDVTVYDFSTETPMQKTIDAAGSSNEGVYYEDDNDELYVVSRSSNQINTYTNISALLEDQMLDIETGVSSSSDLQSPRKIAVDDNIVVVADNADVDGDETTADGRFFIYTKTAGALTLRNTVEVDFAVWGITFKGNDLLAVVDKTSDLAIFENFASSNTTDAVVAASKTITIEGINRTHGIDYDDDDDVLVLTDIGSADSDSDGGFHVITDATAKLNAVANGDMLAVGQQTRIAGSATMLGNPVDVAYDDETKTIFIAEVANGGGRVLAFSQIDYTNGGDITPSVNNSLSGANSLYYHEED
ncbi:hypothetical protein [Mesonia sp.]|uniref:hypothetical protein n=1 Tax=Mesonia sp. TaxID=1960830 RepID=UPI00175ABCE8|nr:hypothetical protein [Mesonia sp.]HIB36138.1 hypothetical protein [Mesonia sp.]HIO27121.1 hypothetical protein [Flavobacteriaceae bacterium]